MKHTIIKERGIIDIRKVITIVGLMFVTCLACYAKPNKVDSLAKQMTNVESQMQVDRQEMAILQKEIEICEKSIKSIDEHVDRVNEGVSNQIASSSHIIQTWGIIFSILSVLLTGCGIAFGYYINRMWKKINNLQDNAQEVIDDLDSKMNEIAEQQQRVSANQTEIITLQMKINTDAEQIQQNIVEGEKQIEALQDLYGKFKENSAKIYTQLHREETKRILSRLEEIPEDISNFADTLLSRNLEETDFDNIYTAYHNLIQRYLETTNLSDITKLREKDNSFFKKENMYELLFAQHFLRQAIMKDDLQYLIRKDFAYLMTCYYRNDVEKSTEDLKLGVQKLDSDLMLEIIKEYINALVNSKYRDLSKLYKVLLTDLNEDQLNEIWSAITRQNSQAYTFAGAIKDIIENFYPQSTLLNIIAAYVNSTENTGEKEQYKS